MYCCCSRTPGMRVRRSEPVRVAATIDRIPLAPPQLRLWETHRFCACFPKWALRDSGTCTRHWSWVGVCATGKCISLGSIGGVNGHSKGLMGLDLSHGTYLLVPVSLLPHFLQTHACSCPASAPATWLLLGALVFQTSYIDGDMTRGACHQTLLFLHGTFWTQH